MKEPHALPALCMLMAVLFAPCCFALVQQRIYDAQQLADAVTAWAESAEDDNWLIELHANITVIKDTVFRKPSRKATGVLTIRALNGA